MSKKPDNNKKLQQRKFMPYRDNVACVVFNSSGQVFVGERKSGKAAKTTAKGRDRVWQFPQGGIDAGEEPLEAARRELYEETSIKTVSFISATSNWVYYDIPDEALGIALRGKFRGQRQKYFAFLFEGSDDEINVINPANGKHRSEFSNWRWEKLKNTPDLIVPFKRQAYLEVVKSFTNIAKSLKNKTAKVKKLKAKNIDAWVELKRLFFTNLSRKLLKQGCEKTLADKKQIAFGLFDNDMMVGFAEISERSIGDGKQIAPYAYLEIIYVAKQYRQNGLGKNLIKKAQKWAKKNGLKIFASDARVENKMSILAHTSWGFEEDKRIVLFKKKL